MNNYNTQMSDQFDDTFSLKSFLLLCLGYWKWFLLSLVVFVGLGLFYAYTRQPVYERYEEILVKDQEAGTGVGSVDNSFSQLGLFSSNTKVYNELIAFTSPAVMFDVVKRLDLTMNYTHRDGLKKYTLYGANLPVVINFVDLGETENVGLKFYLAPDDSFVIKKMYRMVEGGPEEYEGEVSGTVNGGPVATPLGNIEVTTNPGYIPAAPRKDTMQIDVFRQSLQGAVEKYLGILKGDLADQDADVIRLTIHDTSKQRADDILNLIVVVYNELWVEDHNKMSVATSKFISERLASIDGELDDIDERIAALKSEMQMPDLEEAAKGYLAEEFAIKEEIRELSTRLAGTIFLKEYMQKAENKYVPIPMNTGTDNPLLEQQIMGYNEVLMLRNNLADNSSAQNPLVADYSRQLDGLRSSILTSMDSYIANLTSAIDNIMKDQGQNRAELTASPHKAKDLLQVERQQVVMEELYLFLLQKREENELTQSFIANNVRVITPPYGPNSPISPNKVLIIIIAVFLGLAIPGVALYLAEASNTKIRSKKDVENLPIPFAGEIPHVGKNRKWLSLFKSKKGKQKAIDKPKVVVSEGKRDIPNEAFRVVRSNIDLMSGKGEHNVIALTSFNPGSGKSFVAFNLGASFAIKGKRVLLIDGDLRHGSLSGYVNSPRRGLTSYLNGTVDDWNSLCKAADGFSNFMVLPIGNRPPNPAELLENGRLEDLIRQASMEFDVVLIDCPPINIVVDTQIINQYVDRTLFVVRAGLLEKKALADLVNLVNEKKLKNITVLLNGTNTKFSTYHTYGNYEAIDKL